VHDPSQPDSEQSTAAAVVPPWKAGRQLHAGRRPEAFVVSAAGLRRMVGKIHITGRSPKPKL
jgi:hypothetical protein